MPNTRAHRTLIIHSHPSRAAHHILLRKAGTTFGIIRLMTGETWRSHSQPQNRLVTWRIVGQPEVGNSDRERCSVSDNWRLGDACPLDRVQAITPNSYSTCELYQPECTCRRVPRETARHLGGQSFPSPPDRSKQSTIAPPCPPPDPQ